MTFIDLGDIALERKRPMCRNTVCLRTQVRLKPNGKPGFSSAIGADKHRGRTGMNGDVSVVVWAGNRECERHSSVPCINGFVRSSSLSKEGFRGGQAPGSEPASATGEVVATGQSFRQSFSALGRCIAHQGASVGSPPINAHRDFSPEWCPVPLVGRPSPTGFRASAGSLSMTLRPGGGVGSEPTMALTTAVRGRRP